MQHIAVTSEIGTLKRVLTHSPDGGIGKVVPTKAQDWLYEDIVDLREMQQEYDVFKQLLLAFLDETTLKTWFAQEAAFLAQNPQPTQRAAFKKPDRPEFLHSEAVVEIQSLLVKILQNDRVRDQLVAAICAVERCDFDTQQLLSDKKQLSAQQLAKTLITGFMTMPHTQEERQIFPPLPNFIFTRDIGIVIDHYLLLSKTAKQARLRESIITKYIAYFELFPQHPEKVIEVTEDDEYFLCEDAEKESKVVTIEGGDLMMIAPQHLLIGYSERTSANAIDKMIKRLFSLKKIDGTTPLLQKISVIVIPKWRGTMHIDTIFTQVDRGTWVLHSPMSLEGQPQYNTAINYISDLDGKPNVSPQDMTGIRIVQFLNEALPSGRYRVHHDLKGLEDLMRHVSREDFGYHATVRFIYSGNAEYPYDEREQWTDACNVVALREGVVVGYDRNHKTTEAFLQAGFGVLKAQDLIAQLQHAYHQHPQTDLTALLQTIVPQKCLLLIPSSELSRARGGTHCMTMPLYREFVQL